MSGAAPHAVAQSRAPSAERLRAQVMTGGLLADHGVRPTCPRCDGLIVTRAKNDMRALSTSSPAGYGPADLQKAYHLPAGNNGAATTVAVIDAGVDPNLEHDLGVYRTQYRLPACTSASKCLKLVDYTGAPQPAPPTSAEGRSLNEAVATETSLDMDAVSAACPSCRLIEVSLPWQDAADDNDVTTTDFARAVDTAVRLGAKVVSISYGYTADLANTSGSDLKSFTRPGVAIVASTGDNGFNGGIHQSWPSDLPSVIAVGGTTLKGDGSQQAWSGAGSGCEIRFPAAAGQPKSVTALCGGHRAAADISADADPATGLAVYDSYAPSTHDPLNWAIIGGTSASAPFIGGLAGRAGHLASIDGPRTFYRASPTSYIDVTSGDIGGRSCGDYRDVSARMCSAGKGYDGPTGIGTPLGLTLFGAANPTVPSCPQTCIVHGPPPPLKGDS